MENIAHQAEAIKHAQAATEDLRRVVYDLRPPALDDLGLLGVIQAQAIIRARQAGLGKDENNG